MQLERFIEKKILPFFCLLLLMFKKKKPLELPPKNILVVRFWGLGESILTLPMIRALKSALPDSKITVLCTKRNQSVFYKQPFINSSVVVWSFSAILFMLKNFHNYDLVIDSEPHFAISAIVAFFAGKRSIGFDFGPRSRLYDVNVHYNDSQHVVYTFCDMLAPLNIKFPQPKALIPLKYDDGAKNEVELRFEALKIPNSARRKTIIGMHAFCGSTAPYRAWPKERFAQLIDRIKEKYDCIIILSGYGSESLGNREIISMLKDPSMVYDFSNLPPQSFFYLVEQYDLMVSNDTGPMHVAAAQGVTTFGLFGPETPVRFGPFPPAKNRSFYHNFHNPPLINVHLGKVGKCDGECLRLITVDEVFTAVDEFLRGV